MRCQVLNLALSSLPVSQVADGEHLARATSVLDYMRGDLDDQLLAVLTSDQRLSRASARGIKWQTITRRKPPGGIGTDQI